MYSSNGTFRATEEQIIPASGFSSTLLSKRERHIFSSKNPALNNSGLHFRIPHSKNHSNFGPFETKTGAPLLSDTAPSQRLLGNSQGSYFDDLLEPAPENSPLTTKARSVVTQHTRQLYLKFVFTCVSLAFFAGVIVIFVHSTSTTLDNSYAARNLYSKQPPLVDNEFDENATCATLYEFTNSNPPAVILSAESLLYAANHSFASKTFPQTSFELRTKQKNWSHHQHRTVKGTNVPCSGYEAFLSNLIVTTRGVAFVQDLPDPRVFVNPSERALQRSRQAQQPPPLLETAVDETDCFNTCIFDSAISLPNEKFHATVVAYYPIEVCQNITPEPSEPPSPSPFPSQSPSPSPLPAVFPSPVPSPTPSLSFSPSPSVSPSPTPSVSFSPSPFPSPSPTNSPSPSPVLSVSPSPSPHSSPSPAPAPSSVPSSSPSPVPVNPPSPFPSPSPSPNTQVSKKLFLCIL